MYVGAESSSNINVLKKEAEQAITAANNIFTGFLRANVETIKLEQARPQLITYLTPVIALAAKMQPAEVKNVLENTTVTKNPAGGYVIRIPDKPSLARQRDIFLLIRDALLFGLAFWFVGNVLLKGKKAVIGEEFGNHYGLLPKEKKFRIHLTDTYGRGYTMETKGYSEREVREKALIRMVKRFGRNIIKKGIRIQAVT